MGLRCSYHSPFASFASPYEHGVKIKNRADTRVCRYTCVRDQVCKGPRTRHSPTASPHSRPFLALMATFQEWPPTKHAGSLSFLLRDQAQDHHLDQPTWPSITRKTAVRTWEMTDLVNSNIPSFPPLPISQ